MKFGSMNTAQSIKVQGRAPLLITGAIGLLLVLAIAFQLVQRLHEQPQVVPRTPIANILPKSLEGWSVADESLGQTEAVSDTVLKTLNLDDYVYRRYARSGNSFTVYAAYWAPGRMPTRLVASHTPDRCWTENGMKCVEMSFRQQYQLEQKPLLPAEYRAFTPGQGGEKTYVAYWHLVEGKVYDYGERFNAVPSPWLWWKDTLAQAAYGSREQLFVRIASNLPITELWKNADFQQVMGKVAGMGLWAPAQ